MLTIKICLIIITVCLVTFIAFGIAVFFGLYKIAKKTIEVIETVEDHIDNVAEHVHDVLKESKKVVKDAGHIVHDVKDATKHTTQKVKDMTSKAKYAKMAVDLFHKFKRK